MEFNWNLILAGAVIIIGVTEYVKSLFNKKSENAVKRVSKISPFILCLLVGAVLSLLQGFNLWEFVFYSLLSLGFSVTGYETIMKFIKSFSEKIKK
jgi:hypothetical protein